jgi:hypothetical protein
MSVRQPQHVKTTPCSSPTPAQDGRLSAGSAAPHDVNDDDEDDEDDDDAPGGRLSAGSGAPHEVDDDDDEDDDEDDDDDAANTGTRRAWRSQRH